MALPAHTESRVPGGALGNPLSALLEHLLRRHPDRVRHYFHIPSRPASVAPLPEELDPRLRHALRRRGIRQLYSHQARSWETSVRRARDLVIATPTASGKSLCYHLPALQAALGTSHSPLEPIPGASPATLAPASPDGIRGRSLYLFPTKALARDQLHELLSIDDAGHLGLRVHTYDGDTPAEIRRTVREHADIVLTNPDMLHQGILPHHPKWARLFETLAFVVVDEIHGYRGVFGSHVANVLRRLERICRFYGRQPRFILCSATIANPRELGCELTGRDVELIDESGAPQGERHVLLWNPPVVNPALGLRAPLHRETAMIAAQAIEAGCKSIVFARTRTAVEVLTRYLKDRFDAAPGKDKRVKAYRGGYLPNERRHVEVALRDDEIECVVATSALELGVDIGGLDVSILSGYPGTIAGTWQRLGRAGRRSRPALGMVVASSAPLDQYVVRHPELLERGTPERARINPDQLLISFDHMRAAAFELPFKRGERFGRNVVDEFMGYLSEQGLLHEEADIWHWVGEDYPANSISLRSVAEGNFIVVDQGGKKPRTIGETDYASAALTLYEGAIYHVQGVPWQVEVLDWEGRKAYVRRTGSEYYTDAIDYTRLRVLEEFDGGPAGQGVSAFGEVHLVRRVAGYKKIRYYSHENIGYGPVHLPDQEMHTSAVWWQLSASILDELFPDRWHTLEALVGAAYALRHGAAFLLMCEPHDLGSTVGDSAGNWSENAEQLAGHGTGATLPGYLSRGPNVPEPIGAQRFAPAVFLYDNYPGGIGLSEALYQTRGALIENATALVLECDCKWGCPACIGPQLAASRRRQASPTSTASAKQGAGLVLSNLRPPPAAGEPGGG